MNFVAFLRVQRPGNERIFLSIKALDMSLVVLSSLFLRWSISISHDNIFMRSEGKCKMQYACSLCYFGVFGELAFSDSG